MCFSFITISLHPRYYFTYIYTGARCFLWIVFLCRDAALQLLSLQWSRNLRCPILLPCQSANRLTSSCSTAARPYILHPGSVLVRRRMADEDAHEPYLLIFSDIKNKLGCIGPSKISWRVACALHGIGTERLGANAGSRFSWIRTKQQPSFLFLKKHSEHLSKKFRSTRKLPSLHFRKGWQDKKGQGLSSLFFYRFDGSPLSEL